MGRENFPPHVSCCKRKRGSYHPEVEWLDGDSKTIGIGHGSCLSTLTEVS
jgi:hypothetical protein